MHRVLLVVVAFAAAVTTAGAQTPIPIGSPVVANSLPAGLEDRPAVAMDGAGGFVVVWDSYWDGYGSGNGDASGHSVQGQVFAPDAAFVGSQFLANSYTTGQQRGAAVAMAATGDFVVVWDSTHSADGDTSFNSIHGQRFAADGGAQGSQFQVNTYTTGPQTAPAIGMDESGNFVVAWRSLGSDNGDTSSYSIQGRRFDASGGVVGAQFLVNSYTTSNQDKPAVAMNGSGDFVVVWHSYGSYGDDFSSLSIQGQVFAADGGVVGGQFQVNSYTTDSQMSPAVAMDVSGAFVVVWQSDGSDNGDASDFSIQGQAFAADGSAVGAQFLVNSYTTGPQSEPAISVDGLGDFVVVWHGHGPNSGGTGYFSIHGQRLAADGSAVGSQFLVNSYTTTGSHFFPAVAMDGADGFAVAWEGAEGNINGQRFRIPIFTDGFESGDVSAWSAIGP